MPKRTSNSSVNSSIRQQTKSNEEGMGQLLEAQQASLGELSSIRQLLQLSKEHQKNQQVSSGNADVMKMQMEMLQTMKEQTSSSKRHYKTAEENFKRDQANWDAEAKKLAELSQTMNTTGNMFQEMSKSSKERMQNLKEKTSIKDGGLKRTVLGAVNVGGIFNKSIAKSEWMSKQKAMGFNPTKEDAEGAYKASKDMKAHEADIAKFQKKTGITDEAEMRRTPKGAALLDKRISLGEQMTKFDMGAQRFDPTVKGMVNPDALKKTPTESAAKETQNEEAQLEGARTQQGMADTLKKIEENTRTSGAKGGPTPEKVKPAEGGGFMDTIFNFLGDGFMKALKSIFSPSNLLKTLGKVFAIGAIIGALWEGISDGFNEFMATGDIGKALIAGLAGIVDFLTFGLFDKDKIKEVIGDMAAWIDDHIVKPVSNFFGAMKDSFLGFVSKIGIPEMTIFKNPITDKEYKIGPFYPFAGAAPKTGGNKPEAATPTSASSVDKKSADNAAAAVPESGGGNKTNVVNAPVTNNTTQNQVIRAPIRNQDSSANTYLRQRYA
jgi:hypothetical protein